MMKAFYRWNARRKSINELSALSNKTLEDIGISRGEIYTVVEDLLNRKGY